MYLIPGGIMKTFTVVIALVFVILCFPNYGMAQQKEKSKMKEESITMERPKSADWRHFKKPDDATLRRNLTPLQYKVTQKEGTEPPFQNEYDNNKREGIYVDIVSGEPLFSSKDKFESGTGWPSFTKPLAPENIVTREDRGFFTVRTEVRSKHGDSHLGHVFRWAAADGAAVLHEFCRHEIHTERGPGKRRIRGVQETLSDKIAEVE